MNSIIFIDDENDILESYKSIFNIESTNELQGLVENLFGDEPVPNVKRVDKDKYKVLTASQGEEGIEKIIKEKNDGDAVKVAFIDMRMPPGINGVETAKRIRELDDKIEIVMVTAYSDHTFSDVVDQIGSPDKILYLKKPFDSQEIIQLAYNLCVKYDQERIKDNFLASISHEFNTPLSCIIGFQQLIQEGVPPSSSVYEYVNLLGESAYTMKNLVEELLLTVEFKEKGVKISPQKTNVTQFVQKFYDTCYPLFVNSNLEYELIDNTKGKDFISIDPMRVKQCLNNLIGNALKFTESGKVIIRLETDKDFAYISIEDSGIGMASDKLDIIFKKFSRIENEHHHKIGLGLGLNIVKEIMDAHQSIVNVSSKVGVGTKFELQFRLIDL